MFNLFYYVFKTLIYLFTPRRELIAKLLLRDKELEILKRKYQKQIKTRQIDRFFFVILNKIMNIKNMIRIVQPETLLSWRDEIIKNKWRTKTKNVLADRRLIRKQNNLFLE